MARRPLRLRNSIAFKISHGIAASDLQDIADVDSINDQLLQEDAVWDDSDASELQIDTQEDLYVEIPLVFYWSDGRSAEEVEAALEDHFGTIEVVNVVVN